MVGFTHFFVSSKFYYKLLYLFLNGFLMYLSERWISHTLFQTPHSLDILSWQFCLPQLAISQTQKHVFVSCRPTMTKCYRGNFILKVIVVRHRDCHLSSSSTERRDGSGTERFVMLQHKPQDIWYQDAWIVRIKLAHIKQLSPGWLTNIKQWLLGAKPDVPDGHSVQVHTTSGTFQCSQRGW